LAKQQPPEFRSSAKQGQPGENLGVSPALHRFALITSATTFCLIIAGALVVGHGAGLAVPDWPLSFGTYMPPMVGGVFYEHGHRMIAGTVAVLTTAMAVWLWLRDSRAWMRWLGAAGLAAVILQAILGGLTVLYRLPTPIVVFHACLAQLFFCITLSLVVFTGPIWNQPAAPVEDSQSPRFRQLTAATSAALFVQLVLGAALRHHALDVVPHVIGAIAVTILAGWTVIRAMTQLSEFKPLQRLASLLGVLLIVQLALGGTSYLMRLIQSTTGQRAGAMLIWTTTAHVATGAAILGISWVLTLLSFRRLAAPKSVSAFEHHPQKSPA
jgi:cytochrome c oxidase assembly protein subunit 15